MSYKEKSDDDIKVRDRIFTKSGIVRFGERLKSSMNGMSNSELARKSGMSEATIRKYLRGDIYPGIDSAALVAEACGVSLVWLVNGVELKDDTGEPIDEPASPILIEAIIRRLPEDQVNALTDAIISHGVSGILTALNGMAEVSEFLQLSDSERAQALRVLAMTKKGADKDGELNSPQSPASDDERQAS